VYDPFSRGSFPVGVRAIVAEDKERSRTFPIEIWYPAAPRHLGQDLVPETQDVSAAPPRNEPRAQMAVRDAAANPGRYPLIVYSHHSGGNRRSATFLSTHLSSHGYVVAALDHSEAVASDLKPREGESAEARAARAEAMIASRVPDVRFLLDRMFSAMWDSEASLDPTQIGIVGHSFGGWTALAAPEVEPRIQALVALAPAGASNPRPGILRATLTFRWGRDVPAMYLVAENDVPLPLSGMYELFERTPGTKRMAILRRADHLHFIDNIEEEHEALRNMPLTGREGEWMLKEMRPASELCSGETAHAFVRGLTLCHFDAALSRQQDAQEFLSGNIEAELAKRDIPAYLYDGSARK
jgi:dienelactone hydrolase